MVVSVNADHSLLTSGKRKRKLAFFSRFVLCLGVGVAVGNWHNAVAEGD
jgi:hypothetical protein